MVESPTRTKPRNAEPAFARASEQAWGVAAAVVFGVGLLLATIVIVVRNGADPESRLNMLGVYFPGYHVSWLGSAIGFVYAFVVGYALGRTVATLYNKMAR